MKADIIQTNKEAWDKIAYDHYLYFKEALKQKTFKLNPIVDEELGNVEGKRILHLQCNTGADSILLARKGAHVVGVDLSSQNIHYAKQLAKEFQIEHIDFIEADVLDLINVHQGAYDLVISTDGVLGWLPDLNQWGRVVHHFLKEEGECYIHDSHPMMMIFDEAKLESGELIPKYPYFETDAEISNEIGGYASSVKEAKNYFFGHQLQSILNAFIQNNMYLTMFVERDRCISGMGGSKKDEQGLMYYPQLKNKIPLVYSLKAKKR